LTQLFDLVWDLFTVAKAAKADFCFAVGFGTDSGILQGIKHADKFILEVIDEYLFLVRLFPAEREEIRGFMVDKANFVVELEINHL
jgi:hypothetical protein